jgi:hypothetical protein
MLEWVMTGDLIRICPCVEVMMDVQVSALEQDYWFKSQVTVDQIFVCVRTRSFVICGFCARL